MEVLIGMSFVFAFVLLGALISLGNERQRRAIDGLREQAEAWAEQDIRIKREKLVRQIAVPDPQAWLEKTAAQILGSAPGLVAATPWQKDNLTAIIAVCKDGRRLVFTPLPRERFLKAVLLKGRGVLAQAETSLLGDKPKAALHYELSVLTSGMFFDIEADQVWLAITGQSLPSKRLTMFEVPPRMRAK
jgi:hypothetical protein